MVTTGTSKQKLNASQNTWKATPPSVIMNKHSCTHKPCRRGESPVQHICPEEPTALMLMTYSFNKDSDNENSMNISFIQFKHIAA